MKLTEGKRPSVPSAAMRTVSVVRRVEPQGLRQMERIAVRQVMIPAIVLVWSWLATPAQFSASAASAEPAAVSGAGVFTADLNYQETDEVLISRSLDFKIQNNPFQKEPALPGQKVFRGSLVWGPRPEQDMAFIWDKGRGKLLLDLNRNRDLTDDPEGVFASASRDDSQSFTNLHLVLPTAAGNRSVRLQVDCYSSPAGGVRAYVGLCSYWQARLSRYGMEWQFGLVESVPDGKAIASPKYLLLRPWAERQRAFLLTSSSPDFCNFTKNVFFGNHAYELDCRYEPGRESPKYKVTFKEQAPRLGEVKVTGADLHRLILTAKPAMTVVLDQPAGTVKLPVGSYALEEIWLRKGETDVLRLNAVRVAVDEQQPASLVAGGPLTNSVEAKSQGQNLQLNYKLLGADGGTYRMRRPDYKHPPECAVFQGTNRLATGKFEFG